MPVLTEDPHLLQILKPVCDAAARARGAAAGSVRSSVETEIQRLLPRSGANLRTIARALAISQRTLSRRLCAEGTNFSVIMDAVRRSLAEQYVGEQSIPLSQAARLLGYDGQTSFTHAYRRWTGTSPSAARKQHTASSGVAVERRKAGGGGPGRARHETSETSRGRDLDVELRERARLHRTPRARLTHGRQPS